MKRLIIVRHAKSDWGHEGLKDIDRPLNQRGYRDAYDMANWYSERYDKPDLIVTSDATRALSTAFIFARVMEIPSGTVSVKPEIYEANTEKLRSVISNLPDTANTVMLFGHNPGLTNFANAMCEDLDFDNVPTTGVLALDLNTKSWKDSGSIQGKTVFYKYPKEFKQ